jgi:hypothetical protein
MNFEMETTVRPDAIFLLAMALAAAGIMIVIAATVAKKYT